MDGTVAATVVLYERSDYKQNLYSDWVYARCEFSVPTSYATMVKAHSAKRWLVPLTTQST